MVPPTFRPKTYHNWELPSYDKFRVEMLVEPQNFPHYLYNEIIVLDYENGDTKIYEFHMT